MLFALFLSLCDKEISCVCMALNFQLGRTVASPDLFQSLEETAQNLIP